MAALLVVAFNLGLFILATSLPAFREAHHHWIFPALAAFLALQWAAAMLPAARAQRPALRACVVSLLGVLLVIGIARHATILACFDRCGFKLAGAAVIAAAVFLAQRAARDAGFWDPLRSGLAACGALLWAAYLALLGQRAAPWIIDLIFVILALLLWLGRARALPLVLSLAIVAGLAARATANEFAIIGLSVIWSVALPLLLVHRVDAWLRLRARPSPAQPERSRRVRLLIAVARAAAIGGITVLLGIFMIGPTFLMTNPEQRRARLLKLAPPSRDAAALSPSAARLREHVMFLAQTVGERSVYQRQAQKRARDYVAARLKAYGYAPRLLDYKARGLAGTEHGAFSNIEALLPASPAREQGAWIIGAHYDSAPGTPGADDNASGVAVMLEVARALKGRRMPREIRFVAFDAEEPPAFGTRNMGSFQYAVRLKENGVKVHGMLSLEMLGYYNPKRGSQLYPPFLHLVNPSQGDFLGAASNVESRGLLRAFQKDWEAGSDFPLTTSILPGPLSTLALSDQLNFWDMGFPALLLSDTAFYRNPHYHQESDVPATLDYERMAAAAAALISALDPEQAARRRRELDDASRLNRTAVAEIVEARSEADVRRALELARRLGAPVSIAGRRHSMGGQTIARGGVALDMTGLRELAFDERSGVLSAGAGATWEQVQRFLDPRGRSVKVMQSDNIFSVGGSMSVNAHGWQPRSGPLASTVRAFRLMLASGEARRCSRQENPDLFRGVLGGYGLLGVILDAELETVPNELYVKRAEYFPAERYAGMARRLLAGAGLAYGRMSVDREHFLTEASLNLYKPATAAPEPLPAMSDESLVALKRAIFRASERGEAAKRRRWLIEKSGGVLLEAGGVTRNTVMNPDMRVLAPEDPRKRDILHEYFVPYERLKEFLAGLRAAVPRHRQNLLNVTLRDVRQDQDTLLAYAKTDVCAVVLYFSQDAGSEGEDSMRAMTRELVDRAVALGGSFYLPYRLHYTREQFRKAYPRAAEFFALKRRHDPAELFQSEFYLHVKP